MLRYIVYFILVMPLSFCWSASSIEEVRIEKKEYEISSFTQFSLDNLMGKITVEPSSSSKLELVATVHAIAENIEKAKALAGTVSLWDDKKEGQQLVTTLYPLQDVSLFYYPGEEKTKAIKYRFHYRDRDITLFTEPAPAATCVYVDFALKVPVGVVLNIHNLAGAITVVDSSLTLACTTSIGKVNIEKCSGTCAITTSGNDIFVNTFQGTLSCQTGSGDVVVNQITGTLNVHTGSGDIQLSHSKGDDIYLQTGSGSMAIDYSSGSLTVYSGSGKIHCNEIVTGKKLFICTGSGSVKLKGDFSKSEEFGVQTGSGNITVLSHPFPEVRIYSFTGSGTSRIDIPGSKNKVISEGHVEASFGTSPHTLFVLQSGSGNIRVSNAKK